MKLPLHCITYIAVLSTLIFFSSSISAQTVDYGKSYINITKGAAGGTMEPGDTLQIRATFVVKSGTLDSCAFYDNIPAGTSYIPGSLAVLTNEGKIYKAFTDPAGDDAGSISAGGAISINLGYNTGGGKQATAFRRGQIKNSDKPSFFGGTCIMVASYKIKITAALGSQVNVGGGSVTYKSGASAITVTNFPADRVAIFSNYGLCANSVGANALGTEFNGTFGQGKNKNRGSSANVPPSYTYAAFASNMPNDYYYGIANNTSTAGLGYSTINSWPKPDPSPTSHRVFGVWDIIGDHTGAVNAALGNPPADTVNKNNGGYMLVINASYRIDSAFNQTISGLCPNTYYEFSVWIRNICSKCGCDSNGTGASGGGYIPTAAGDSSGVKPNLTLAINGIDYYTTGDVAYNGQWIKKGFTYLTGPLQTSLTAMIRNNAPGGGGNDWAIDDITLATCTPNLNLNPSPNVTVCVGNQVDMSSVISCYFSNYIYWTWEKSMDNGVTWLPTGVSGTGTPVNNAGQWQYTATYPSFLADPTLNNARFRIKVASTPLNLNDANCSYYAMTTITVLTSLCSALPDGQLTTFTGKLVNEYGKLDWTTVHEAANMHMELEKSTDGIHYQKKASIDGTAINGEAQTYTYTDNEPMAGVAYYRLKIVTPTGYAYSRVVGLYAGNIRFDVRSVVNPFNEYLSFEAITSADRTIIISLFDGFGRLVKQRKEPLLKGVNKILVSDLGLLSNGNYQLQVSSGNSVINKKVIKIKQ